MAAVRENIHDDLISGPVDHGEKDSGYNNRHKQQTCQFNIQRIQFSLNVLQTGTPFPTPSG